MVSRYGPRHFSRFGLTAVKDIWGDCALAGDGQLAQNHAAVWQPGGKLHQAISSDEGDGGPAYLIAVW